MIGLSAEKVIILVGMLVATFIFGMIPIKLVIWNSDSGRRPPWLKKSISLANCFSGGVFVAACLLDLFPDVQESVENVLNEIVEDYHLPYKIDYPVANFIIVLGFLIVLIAEQLILEVQEKWKTNTPSTPRAIRNHSDVISINAENGEIVSNGQGPEDAAETDSLLSQRLSYGSTTNFEASATNFEPSPAGVVSSGRRRRRHSLQTERELLRQRYVSGESNGVRHEIHDEGLHSHDHSQIFEEHSALRSLILLLALTFHSIFEGLAIGLQVEYGKLISIFVAVVVHKAIMAFSLGLNLAQSHGLTVKYFITANVIFSLASPIGMAIGIALSDMQQSLAGDIANGVLQGIAGGTFLYITFFEVLPHEFSENGMRLPKVLCVLLGYSIICGILFLTH